MTRSLSSMRMSYELDVLGDTEIDSDPVAQFSRWFDEAIAAGPGEANAMMVSTVGADGQPSSRVVLMKAFGPGGFEFYTNYDSQKGQEIAAHPRIAALFYWPTLQRQVRITGIAEKLSPEQSDAYFHSRPRGSQIGAIVSPQSQVVPDRAWLEEHFAMATHELEGQMTLERPDHWGGFRIVPETIEFWQGRPNRLHDRIRYDRGEDGRWSIHRLAP
ncbi:MAG TPA: pyridoxamine 5'-phosphate oxidase [Thermomicrobiales bacterium]|nr:pyridoxamine 5'-phosphate oxidase [Thermomicrobiales bacterium]